MSGDKHPLTRFRERQMPPMSIGELADLLKVRRNTVWRWEKGRLPEASLWLSIQNATGVRPEDLVRHKTAAPEDPQPSPRAPAHHVGNVSGNAA